MNHGRVNPAHRLEDQGITGFATAHYNLIEPALVAAAVARGEGEIGQGGAFLCSTGQFTGRSPKDKFVVRTPLGWRFTPLILVVLALESSDVMFAVDSVPAVLAVSQDPFVVYSSNIFAILGLRALYFVLAGALAELRYLRPALALILVLIGFKMLLADVMDVPTALSLVAVATIIGVATAASIFVARRERPSGGTGKPFDESASSR